MKALSKLHREEGLWLINDAEKPQIGPNDLLIQIKKTAICGTDMHIYNWDHWAQNTIPAPMILPVLASVIIFVQPSSRPIQSDRPLAAHGKTPISTSKPSSLQCCWVFPTHATSGSV